MARQKTLSIISSKKDHAISARKRPQSVTGNDKGVSLDNSDGSESRHKKVRWEGRLDTEEEYSSDVVTTDKIVLAALCQNHRFACAYYDPLKFTMYVLEDTSESNHFDLTRLALEQINPGIALTSARADDNFIDLIREFMDTANAFFQIRPHKDFVPAKGLDRLLSLRFLSELPAEPLNESFSHVSSDEPTNAYDFMRRRRGVDGDPTMKKWNASIRMGNFAAMENAPLCISAVGALLDHLAKARAVSDLDDEGIGGLEIRAIEGISLEGFMHINADALASLQIFDDESHASVHSDKTKEGLSLFGILDATQTSLGRNLLRQWLLRPSLSIPIITARHDAVACFLRPENIVIADAMHNHLKGFRNIPRILRLLQGGKGGIYEWQGLVKFTFHSALLRETLTELSYSSEVNVVKQLMNVIDVASFRAVGNAVHEIIDWEESIIAGRVCVRSHIDEELDNWKHIYNGIDGVLSHVAEQICGTVPPNFATSLNVIYFPQLGFLICVPMQEEWKSEMEITAVEGWVFQFSSESHVYFKSDMMHDMDGHIGDLHPFIVDREIEIVQTLLVKVLAYDEAIRQACDVSAELDCLLCFANASRTYDYRRPHMSMDNVINIIQGRHPLQERVVDTFVPNDTFLRGGMGLDVPLQPNYDVSDNDRDTVNAQGVSVVICTGANACGKSVYLKQTALIQYIAQIGCFVPAESATLGIVDKIFTRVQTRESVSKTQSAFMIDLNQVSLALRNCTERSLILLDEFGKGTISSDGAGLFCGVLIHLLSRGSACPKVLAATHFHDVFRDDLLNPALPICFLHMQIMIMSDSSLEPNLDSGLDAPVDGQDDDTSADGGGSQSEGEIRLQRSASITYLYRVAPGLSLDSHAARCAQMFGLPRRLARRAQYVSALLSQHQLGRLLDEKMTEREAGELREAEDVFRRFMAWDLECPDVVHDVKGQLAVVLGRLEPGDAEGGASGSA